MNVFRKIADTVRGYHTEGSLQSFYGALAVRNQAGGPRYSESKRDYEALHAHNDRYLLF
jgi:hypothetical protein